jgi:hypothetical protein
MWRNLQWPGEPSSADTSDRTGCIPGFLSNDGSTNAAKARRPYRIRRRVPQSVYHVGIDGPGPVQHRCQAVSRLGWPSPSLVPHDICPRVLGAQPVPRRKTHVVRRTRQNSPGGPSTPQSRNSAACSNSSMQNIADLVGLGNVRLGGRLAPGARALIGSGHSRMVGNPRRADAAPRLRLEHGIAPSNKPGRDRALACA